MHKKPSAVTFYQYLGAHSLLIGLLPFYLPVYLWGLGYDLTALAFLIGVSGFTFCLALNAWQLVVRSFATSTLLGLTFLIELLLVACVYFVSDASPNLIIAAILGVANGLYNAFFWTTQRTMFLAILGRNDSGKKFGNLQIFVTLFLKLGILLGGVLLDRGGLIWILLFSTVLNISLWVWFKHTASDYQLNEQPSCILREAFEFKDQCGSWLSFRIDGIFLLMESHFWTLSLFFLVKEDFSTLGLVVVVLAAVFAVLFYLIKNTIDHFPKQRVYLVAVMLYVLSWILRYYMNDQIPTQWLFIDLVFITFCTSFFRLAFNKRFFDQARSGSGAYYLLVKSYVSQAYLSAAFFLIAIVSSVSNQSALSLLQGSYLFSAALAVLYFAYKPNESGPH